MKNIFSLSLIIAVIFSFMQCSTDVDLYADYKEITIVYGLIDIDDDTTWLKITKAYTGPGNALEMAKNPDSSNFEHKLDVSLIGKKNGEIIHTFEFDTLTRTTKRAGDSIFYYPDQLMYYSVGSLSVDADYELSVKSGDKELSSQTKMIDDFGVSITPPKYIIFDSDNDKDITVYPTEYGKRYEMNLIFHYKELNPEYPDTLYKTVTFGLGTKKVDDPNVPPSQILFTYLGEVFYTTLDNELEKSSFIKRWAGDVDIVVGCGSLDLNTYLEINGGNSSLLQEIPLFTNIEDGLGLFTSRHTVINTVQLHSNSERKLVNEYPDLGFELSE